MMSKPSLKSAVVMMSLLLPVSAVHAGLTQGSHRSDVLIGADNDNVDNPVIQSVAPPPNQSLNNTDILLGGGGNDVLIGLLGNDTLAGGRGHDIMIGGTEQFQSPNSDIMFGGSGNDVNIWAPGDGSDAFIGGYGYRDAQVFGVIDRDDNNVPILSPVHYGTHKKTGVPTADLTNSPGFCTLERVHDAALGFDFLVRFFVRATGNLAVTVRLRDVEQVFCTSEEGGAITYADLRSYEPQFVEISLHDVKKLNRSVAKIVR